LDSEDSANKSGIRLPVLSSSHAQDTNASPFSLAHSRGAGLEVVVRLMKKVRARHLLQFLGIAFSIRLCRERIMRPKSFSNFSPLTNGRHWMMKAGRMQKACLRGTRSPRRCTFTPNDTYLCVGWLCPNADDGALMSAQVSKLYRTAVNFGENSDSCQKSAHCTEAAHELEYMLDLPNDFVPLYEGNDDHLSTYPNVLNRFGTESNVRQSSIFRDLPNGGRRSPRSKLACSLAESNMLQFVQGLHRAEFFDCCEYSDFGAALQHEEEEERKRKEGKLVRVGFFRNTTVSVHDLLDFDHEICFEEVHHMDEDCQLFGESYEEKCQVTRQLCDRSSTLRADFWRDKCEAFVDKVWHDDFGLLQDLEENDLDGVDAFKQFLAAHMANGGSLYSTIIDSQYSEFEDRYLASEAKDESVEDLHCALLRLKENTIEFVCQCPHSSSSGALRFIRYMEIAKTLSGSQWYIKPARSLVVCALTAALAPKPRPLQMSHYAGN
jgi:hypothetical protein